MGVLKETERIILREYLETDWQAVHEYASRGDILTCAIWGPNSEAETIEFIDGALKSQKAMPRMRFEFAIILKEENRLIGGCDFRFDKGSRNEGSLGYIINPAYWVKGFATEATGALIKYISAELGVTQFEATCDALNFASQRVLEKSGFVKTDLLEKDVEIKGKLRDTLVYRKTL
jgi:RimJ/RimL family protein N-acetyltransferase